MTMSEYINYIGGIVGTTAIVPLMFVIAVVGPVLLFNIIQHQQNRLNSLKWPLAILTFFTCLILFISTGGYIGSLFDSSALGMGAGLVTFYYAYNAFTGLLPSTCPID